MEWSEGDLGRIRDAAPRELAAVPGMSLDLAGGQTTESLRAGGEDRSVPTEVEEGGERGRVGTAQVEVESGWMPMGVSFESS